MTARKTWNRGILLAAVVTIGTGCEPNSPAAEPTDALARAQKNLQESPSFENYINLGLEHANRGERQQALAAYSRARDMAPNSPLAWNNMCAELNSQGRPREALTHCERAVQLEPRFALAQKNLELTRAKLAQTEPQVRSQMKKVLAGAERLGSGELMDLANAVYDMRDYANAAQLWELVPAVSPDYASAQNNRATALILMGRLGEAESCLKTALELDPKNELFLNNQRWLAGLKEKKAAPSNGR